MPTLKFDLILQEFSRRIGDRLDSAFTPGGGAFPAGTLLAAVDAVAYVNKALHKYHGDAWMAVEGDRVAFGRLFPELINDPAAAITFGSGVYIIQNPRLDYFKLYDGYKSTSIPYRIETEDKLVLLQTGKYPRHGPTASKPIVVGMNSRIYVFPTSETSGSIYYIKQPLDPTTGNFLTQHGAYDSPFYNIHNSRIATVAEALYWNEKEPKP